MPRSWSSAARSFGPDGFGWDTFARDPTQRPYAVTASSGDRAGPTESAVAVAADEDPRLARMRAEAVLLISKTPLSPRKLAQLAHLADATAARTLIRQLNQVYDNVGRAIRIEQVAGGYRMLTRPALAPWLTRLGHLPAAVRLSTPMMETLAVVAYRQPVSRASAEAIRGVACGELLRQLMERDLIRIAGRSEELGRPYLYGTTKRFLQVFGLASTDDLPPITWHTLHEDDSSAETLPSENSTDDDPGDRPIDSDNASSNPDLPPDDLSTSTKEPVVSTPVASVLGPAAFGAALAESGGALATEFGHPTMISPPSLVTVATDDDAVKLDSIEPAVNAAPAAIIEDEEDEIYGDDDDEEDDDWDDDDDEDDDWDDDDDEDDDDDDDDEDDDEEELDDDWEEVDDDDEDDDEEEADVEEADVEDDDEDWSEDDDVESDDDDDDEEEWD